MYIGGHERRRFSLAIWSFTHVASHFIKLTTSCIQVPLGAEVISRPVPMGKDD